MVSVQELYEFIVLLVDAALRDIKAAKVFYDRDLLAEAMYHIEQGSEKMTKAILAICLCFYGVSGECSDEGVLKCYSEIAVDRKGSVVEPDDFVREIGHDPAKLLSKLLSILLRDPRWSLHNVLAACRDLGINQLFELLRKTFDLDFRKMSDLDLKSIVLRLAKYIEFTLSSICSNVLKGSRLCESVNRLSEEAKKCEETKNDNICSNLVNNVSEVLSLLSSLMPVKDVWRYLEIRALFEILHIDELQEFLEALVNGLIGERAIHKKVQIAKCMFTVAVSLILNYTLFYLTSPLYNIIRYPVRAEKLDICRDESLRKFKDVENLCSKTFVSSKDVIAEETHVKEFIGEAIEVLEKTANSLKETLSSIKT
ncbi:MAG: hypothetical protein NDP13_06270 [Crenarchaeota archaeon]|nr:hypothetical protein [Thermoproteota archaeon]